MDKLSKLRKMKIHYCSIKIDNVTKGFAQRKSKSSLLIQKEQSIIRRPSRLFFFTSLSGRPTIYENPG